MGVQLPSYMIGTFDETQDACAETVTMTRLTVSQDTLRFYYGYATVDSVTARSGRYDVGATLYHLEGAVEVVPEAATYRIEPGDRGAGIRFDNAMTGEVPSELVRCAGP